MRTISLMGFLLIFGCRNTSLTDNLQNKCFEDSVSYDLLVKYSKDYLICMTQAFYDEYDGFASLTPRYDQERSQLIYKFKGKNMIIAQCVTIGEIPEKQNRWKWAWDDSTNSEREITELNRLKTYGVRRNFDKLIHSNWSASNQDGWEMAMIACYILKAKLALRVQNKGDSGYSFKIITKVNWSDSTIINAYKKMNKTLIYQ